MSDIAKWLKENGLGEHAALFAENDIDVDLLAELTDDDLKELGLSMGHRKRLLRAASAGDVPAEVPIEAATDSAGERRQVTVLFADLAGFTQLSNSLDAEEVHGLLNRYFAVVDGVIERHGGHVDKHIGDALMALFGAPISRSLGPVFSAPLPSSATIPSAAKGLSPRAKRCWPVGSAFPTIISGSTGLPSIHR